MEPYPSLSPLPVPSQSLCLPNRLMLNPTKVGAKHQSISLLLVECSLNHRTAHLILIECSSPIYYLLLGPNKQGSNRAQQLSLSSSLLPWMSKSLISLAYLVSKAKTKTNNSKVQGWVIPRPIHWPLFVLLRRKRPILYIASVELPPFIAIIMYGK